MKRILFFLSLLLLLSGCAPRFLSHLSHSDRMWDSIPKLTELSIRIVPTSSFQFATSKLMFDGRKASELFSNQLIAKIKTEKLFDRIYLISGEDVPKTDYLLEIDLAYYHKESWMSRAFLGDQSAMGIYGRMIDIRKDRAILTYDSTRWGSGGLSGSLFDTGTTFLESGILPMTAGFLIYGPISTFGNVGLGLAFTGVAMLAAGLVLLPLVPGEQFLAGKFIEWSAQDITSIIKRVTYE